MEWFKKQYEEIKSHAKWDLIRTLAALGISVVYPLVQKLRHLSWDWPVFLTIFIVSLVLILVLGRKQPITQQNPQPRQNPDASIPAVSTIMGIPAPAFDSKTYFKNAYYSPVTSEVEKNIRVLAQQNEPSNVEGYLARFIGVGLVAYMHDITWLSIYKSQVLTLQEMNIKGGLLPMSDAQKYYSIAANQNPKVYANYTFDQWLGFMQREQLILRHPSNMLEMTVRGKDFLKYLTHSGRNLAVKGEL